MKRRGFLVIGLSAIVLSACAPKDVPPDAVYYLVRHAEKTTEKPDPALTDAGLERAEDLAVLLEGVPLTAVYSSDYTRTRDTAQPTAETHGLDVQLYNPGALSEFAELLLSETGAILVVGHSNTTPPLAGALGADPGEPIVEANEYNRLYVIERRGDVVTGRIDRFGK